MKINKNINIFLYSMSVSLLILLLGCNYRSEPIRIGVVGTMSGINSDLSVSGRRGVELAVDEFNNLEGLMEEKLKLS